MGIFEPHFFNVGGAFGLFIVLFLLAFGFTIWMIADAIGRASEQFSTPSAKTGWIVALVLGLIFGFGFIVALLYLFIVRIPARRGETASRDTYRAMQTASSGTPPSPGAYTQPAPSATEPPPQTSGAPLAGAPVYCRSCGAKIVAGARFCHSCGTPTN